MKPLCRRDFTRITAGTLAASAGPFFLFPDRALASRKTLRIAQWTHFLPEYDQWFDGEYVKQWGEHHDTTVIVDHIPVDRISARAAREVAAGAGHDLFVFPWPPAMYQRHAIDHTEVYESVSHRHGNTNELGHKSSFNPATGQYFAFVDSWIPFPVHYFGDYWSEVNTPYGPTNYDTLRAGCRKIRATQGIPCGVALVPGLESNITLHSLLWAFRTFTHDEDGNVTINRSYMTIQALKYIKALYNEGGTREALTWGPSGNVRAMLERKTSCTTNAISLLRAAEKENPDLARNILLRPALLGPGGVRAAPHVTSSYVVWKFAQNQDGAKQFLIDLIDNSGIIFEKSGFCNFPIYQDTVPNLINRLSKDPNGGPRYKYEELKDALKWTRNLGHPGCATPQAMEVFETFVIPRMFGRVVKGGLSPEDAARAAEKEVNSIYEKWRKV